MLLTQTEKITFKAPFDPNSFTYDMPDKFAHIYTMRIRPAPRGLQLGLDPTDQDSLPIVLDYQAMPLVSCLVRLRDPETVRFFQMWDKENLGAYMQHAEALGREAAYFDQHYRRMITFNSDGVPQLRLHIDLPGDQTRGTTVFEALPGVERGAFRFKRGTHESVKIGSRLMVRVDAWYLGLTETGYPSCKLHATQMAVFPAEPTSAVDTASAFELPQGVSFQLE